MTRPWLLVLAFIGALSFTSGLVGCSARPSMTQQERQAHDERQSIERPARDVNEESSLTDHLGQIGVVILVITITVAGILLPVLLLS